MIFFSPCKINIGLHIVGKRLDGFHDLETLMFPVRGLCDAVEIVRSRTNGVEFTASGLPVGGEASRNLCVKAYEEMRRAYPIGGVKIHLHKVVPMGAGLGGGSADAAVVIKGLSHLFGLQLSVSTMEALAALIGSDTSFFIAEQPAIATGRGEILSPYDISLAGYRLLVVKPDVSVGTAEAYAQVTPRKPEIPLAEQLRRPVESWRDTVTNDFEQSVFPQHPEIRQIKERLYELGAVYASMSGSGSAVYGIFDANTLCPSDRFDNMFVYQEDMC